MAVTATFRADFTSFVDAVNRAETELKSFETGAAKVERSLARMTDAFSGRRVIQEATQMARVFADMGDGANLTEGELRRMQATANEAIAKLRAMGADVPPGIQKVADATRNTERALGGMTGSVANLNNMLGVFGAGLSATALVGFGKTILDDLGRIQDLSEATGVSTAALQRFAYVGAGAGVSADEMGRAVGTLSERLAGGDASAVGAVQRLGLSVDQMLAAGPEEAFVSIGEAVGAIVDPMQKNAIAADLYGAKLSKHLIPALSDLRDAMQQVPKEAVVPDATLRRIAELGDAWDRARLRLEGYIATNIELESGRRRGMTRQSMQALYGTEFANNEMNRRGQDVALPPGPSVLPALPPGVVEGYRQGADAVDELHAAFTRFREEEAARLVVELKAAEKAARNLDEAMASVFRPRATYADGPEAELRRVRDEIERLDKANTLTPSNLTGKAFIPKLQVGANPQLAALSQTFGKGLSDMLSTAMPQAIMSAITGGGSKIEAIGSTFGAFLTSPKGFGGAISKGLTSVFGPAFGGALNALVPGLGALMGPLLSAMGKKIKALFGGPSEAELSGRALESQFEQTFGSFANMVNAIGEAYRATGRTSEEAQRDVKALLDAEKEGPAAVQAWIDKFNDALEKAKALKDNVDDAVANIDPEELHVPVVFDIPRFPDFPTGDFGPVVPGAATGARVLPFGIQHLARGGFARQGTDTVPAMLTPGELVLNAAQQKNLAGAIAGGAVSVQIVVNNPVYDTPAGRDRMNAAISRAAIDALKRTKRIA